MYRGSRLVASFLLILTGAPMTALALGVLAGATFPGGAWVVVPLAVAFGVAHFVALGGMVVGRAWGRTLAVGLAEAGGGISIAAAIAVLLGADPLGAAGGPETGLGLAAWMTAMYALLGISAGRIRLTGWARRSRWWPTPLLRVAA
ncbi:MAG TPA: hypothetical protein VFO78_10825 [Candidatus Limnocylindrales bacterium]|nr:hypothetical protein [Candidatus Limnocylindrales bacterium]